MPSSGYPIENIVDYDQRTAETAKPFVQAIETNAKYAMDQGMFLEWLGSFIGAYNYLKQQKPLTPKWESANIASQAGLIEWDL